MATKTTASTTTATEDTTMAVKDNSKTSHATDGVTNDGDKDNSVHNCNGNGATMRIQRWRI